MPDTPRLPPLPFAEAIAWARERRVVLPAVYYGELQGLARAAAFTISGLTGLDQIQAVKDSLTRVLETGESFKTWQQRIRDGEIPLEVGPAQIETIFRNNIQQSYNRGRYQQQMGALDSHPWWMYDAVNDSRTRPTHAAMDGYVARHDDPIWSQWTPSCGHRCRCRRIALTADQAAQYQDEDVRRQADPDQAKGRQAALIQGPDPGWGHDPYRDPLRGLREAEQRRLTTVDPELAQAYREQLEADVVPPGTAVVQSAATDVPAFSTIKGCNSQTLTSALRSLGTEQVQALEHFIAKYDKRSMFVTEQQMTYGSAAAKKISGSAADFLKLSPAVRAFAQEQFTQLPEIAPRCGGFTSPLSAHVVVKVSPRASLDKVNPAALRTAVKAAAGSSYQPWRLRDMVRAAKTDPTLHLADWLHEIGHQVHYTAGMPEPPSLRSLSRYGASKPEEWFAEHFSAWVLDRDALAAWDAGAATFIDDVMAKL